MRILLRRLVGNNRGATAVEYGLIVAFIAIAASGAISLFSSKTIAMWNFISSQSSSNL